MASALEAVLALKANEQAQQEREAQQIANAFQIFQNARQQAQANQFAQLQLKAGLAEKGLKLNQDGSFSRDESLLSPIDKLIETGKAATAEKAIYEAGGPTPSIFKGGVQSNQSVVSPASISSPNNVSGQDIVVEKYDEFGRPKEFIDISAKKKAKVAEGIPADKAGLYGLSKESIGNIDKIVDTLFPNKEAKTLEERAKSFDRGAAFQSNTPNLKLPLGMQIGPDFIATEKGQDVYRWASTAVSAKQLIQTGVAARPDETRKLVQAYIPSGVSSSKSSLKGLKELQDFYVTFNNDLKNLGTNELESKYPGVREYLKNSTQSESDNNSPSFQRFTVDGVVYNIPADKVDAFKKAKGL